MMRIIIPCGTVLDILPIPWLGLLDGLLIWDLFTAAVANIRVLNGTA